MPFERRPPQRAGNEVLEQPDDQQERQDDHQPDKVSH
jgi:hypothetical protein